MSGTRAGDLTRVVLSVYSAASSAPIGWRKVAAIRQSQPFAAQLRHYRQHRGLTQEQLAERAGLSARGIRALESGERTSPHRDTVRLLAESLHLSAAQTASFELAAAGGPADAVQADAQPPVAGFLGALPAGPIVGRQREIARLEELLDAVARGAGRLVMLAGEPGIGKTRLAQEVVVRLEEQGFLAATGRCYEPEQALAFYPFTEALAEVYDGAPATVQNETPKRWPYLQRLLPDSLPLPDREDFGGQDVQQRLFRAIAHFLDAIAGIRPVAILLDDLQWADESSLKLLQYLSRVTRASRVFLLGTYRDVDIDRRDPLERVLRVLQREGLLSEIILQRLSEGGTAELAATILGEGDEVHDFAAALHERTDGNPFFIQEVVRALIERGDLFLTDGMWMSRSQTEIEVPRSIRSAIGERLARLREPTQEVLAEACVLGQTFAADDLCALQTHSALQVDVALDEAVSAHLVRMRDTARYSFNHALTQQTLYEELPARRRARSHALAGEALERLPETVRRKRSAEIAWHFSRANQDARALPYALAAGDQAEAVFAHAEALRHYRSALELAQSAEDRPREAEALEKLGTVLRLAMQYAEALDVLEPAATAYRVLDDPEGEARATYQIGVALYMKGQPREAGTRVRATAERLEDLAGPPSFQRALAYVYWALAMPSCLIGRYRDILATSARIAELGQKVDDPRLLAAAAWMRGYGLVVIGAPAEARESLERAVPFFDSTDDRWWLAQVTCQIGRTYLHNGNTEQARRYLQQTLELFEEVDDQAELAWASCYMGDVSFVTGDWTEARRNFARSAGLARTRVPRFYSHALLHLAELSLLEGAINEGMELVEQGLTVAEQCSEVAAIRKGRRLLAEHDLSLGDANRAFSRLQPLLDTLSQDTPHSFPPPVLAEIYLAVDDVTRADELVAERVERFRGQSRMRALANWLRVQAKIRRRQGQPQEAERLLREAISLAESMPYPHAEARARHELGGLLAEQGDFERSH